MKANLKVTSWDGLIRRTSKGDIYINVEFQDMTTGDVAKRSVFEKEPIFSKIKKGEYVVTIGEIWTYNKKEYVCYLKDFKELLIRNNGYLYGEY